MKHKCRLKMVMHFCHIFTSSGPETTETKSGRITISLFFFIFHKNRMQVSEGVECQKEWVVLSSRTIYQSVSLLFKIIKDSQQPNLVSASLGLRLSRVGYNSILVKFNFSKLQTKGSHNGSHYINSCELKNNDSLYKPK